MSHPDLCTPAHARRALDAEGVPLDQARRVVDDFAEAIDTKADSTTLEWRWLLLKHIPGLASVIGSFGLDAVQRALHDSAVPVCGPGNDAGRTESGAGAGWDATAPVTRLGPAGTA